MFRTVRRTLYVYYNKNNFNTVNLFILYCLFMTVVYYIQYIIIILIYHYYKILVYFKVKLNFLNNIKKTIINIIIKK